MVPAAASAQSRFGELRVMGMLGRAPDPDDPEDPLPPVEAGDLAGAGASFSFIMGRLSLGPEAALLLGSDRRVYQFGGVARVGFGSGPFRPFLVLGAGQYFWDHKSTYYPPSGTPPPPSWNSDRQAFTGSLGGGLQAGAAGSPLSAVLELRFHKSLSTHDFLGARDLVSLGVGGRVAW
jgi:hypothetical protein